MKICLKKTFALFLSFCLIFSSASMFSIKTQALAALTGNNELDVVASIQEKSNWCWAACAQMAGRYISGGGIRSQSAIVEYIKGHTNDVPSTIDETAQAATYASFGRETFSYTWSAFTWTRIRNEIDNNRTVLLAAGYYNDNNVRTGGHMVIGIGWTMNTSTDTYYISYIDPWDGKEYFCTYNDFCDGFFNGRKYDRTVYYS